MAKKNPLRMTEVGLPLTEAKPTRMDVQRLYDIFRKEGSSIQHAIRKVEDALDLKQVQVDARGVDVVFFEEFRTAAERWKDGHAGYKFGVFKNGQLIDQCSTFPEARAKARKAGRFAQVRELHSGTKYYETEEAIKDGD